MVDGVFERELVSEAFDAQWKVAACQNESNEPRLHRSLG